MSDQPVTPDPFDYLDEDPAGDQDSDTYIAPDEPMGAHAYGTTAREEREGETFQERSKHTNPEDYEQAERRIESTDAGSGVGQLLQPGDDDVDDIDDETNTIALDVGWDGDDDAPAEEQAMHMTERR